MLMRISDLRGQTRIERSPPNGAPMLCIQQTCFLWVPGPSFGEEKPGILLPLSLFFFFFFFFFFFIKWGVVH